MLKNIDAHYFGSCTEYNFYYFNVWSFKQNQQNSCPHGHVICGHPDILYIGISHFGHLLAKNIKYTNPKIDFIVMLGDTVRGI